MLGRRCQGLKRHLAGVGRLLIVALVITACSGSTPSPRVVVVNTLDALDPLVADLESRLAAALDEDVEFHRIGGETEDLAAVIESLEPDLVVTLSTRSSLAAVDAIGETDIPQLFGMVLDPIESGLVESSEWPGFNRTGIALFTVRRSVDLLFDVTGAKRIAILHQPADAASAIGLGHAKMQASMLGMEVVEVIVATDADLAGILEGGPVEGVDAVLVLGSPFVLRNRLAISNAVATWDVPAAISLPSPELFDGFLLGVATDQTDLARQMTDRAVAILEGGSAGQIPIGVAASISLIDLDEARRLGIQVPDQVLLQFQTILGGS